MLSATKFEQKSRLCLRFLLPLVLTGVLLPWAAWAQVAYTGTAANQNFGSQGIGASSAARAFTFSVTAGTTVGSIGVLTTGVPNLDFVNATGTTCTAETYASPTNCTVEVTFKPALAGVRMGAVVFTSGSANTGTVLGKAMIYGVGTGPQIAYSPGTVSTIPLTGDGVQWLEPWDVTEDAAGNLFVTDIFNASLVEIPAGGGAAILLSGSFYGGPQGVAVDGAGDLFVVDSYMGMGNLVREIVPGGGAGVVIATTVDGIGLSSPSGVTVDVAGDAFIADSGNNRVVEVPSDGGAAIAIAPTVNSAGLNGPNSVAIDGMGDLFIGDGGNNRVVEVPTGGGAAIAIDPTVDGVGLSSVSSVAVDGVGDLFIGDPSNSRVVEAPAGGGTAVSYVNGAGNAQRIAVDGAGDLLIMTALGPDFSDDVLAIGEIQRSVPPAMSFATTFVGHTSSDSPQTVQIENIGNQALTLTGLSYPVDFPEEPGGAVPCSDSTSLSAGQACNLNIDFTPESEGLLSESVMLTDNALNVSGTQQLVPVSGTGEVPAPQVTLSATSVSFGNQEVKIISAAQLVTLTNSGSATLKFDGRLTGTNAGEFLKWSTCTGPLAPGASCTVHLYFIPTAAGPAAAALTITDNASDSPQSIALTGTGTTPSLTLSQSSVAFGEQLVNSTSFAMGVTLSNSGDGPLSASGSITGTNASSFSRWSNCPGWMAAGASCTVYLYFTPTAAVPYSAALTITGNASGSPQSIALTGTGTAALPALTLSQSSVAFGDQTVNTTSAAQSVTLTNSGGSNLDFSGQLTGTNAGEFSKWSNCTGILAPSASCTIQFFFKPTVAGPGSGALTITDNASNSPQQILLTGTGD